MTEAQRFRVLTILMSIGLVVGISLAFVVAHRDDPEPQIHGSFTYVSADWCAQNHGQFAPITDTLTVCNIP